MDLGCAVSSKSRLQSETHIKKEKREEKGKKGKKGKRKRCFYTAETAEKTPNDTLWDLTKKTLVTSVGTRLGL